MWQLWQADKKCWPVSIPDDSGKNLKRKKGPTGEVDEGKREGGGRFYIRKCSYFK